MPIKKAKKPSDELTNLELDSLCYPIFQKLLHELGSRYPDWIVMIEPDTEEYFLGQNDQEVLSRARTKHPKGRFFAYRLNSEAVVDTI